MRSWLISLPEGSREAQVALIDYITKDLPSWATVTEVVRSEFPATDIPYWTEGTKR